MQTNKYLLMAAYVVSLAGCTATMTDRAAKVQVYDQMSSLVDGCTQIGPVSAKAEHAMLPSTIIYQAKNDARDKAAAMGANALVITNTDMSTHLGYREATVQGIALRCNWKSPT